jgi:hypothetical protein
MGAYARQHVVNPEQDEEATETEVDLKADR